MLSNVVLPKLFFCPLLTCQPLKLRVSDPCVLSPQFYDHDQWFHSGVTLRITPQKESVFYAAPVVHADVCFKRSLSVVQFNYRNFRVRDYLFENKIRAAVEAGHFFPLAQTL